MPIRKVDGLIFDLDDTLFDCSGQLTLPARRRAARIFQKARPGLDLQALCRDQALQSERLGSSDAIESIGRSLDLGREVIDRALSEYNRNEVEDIALFPDVLRTFDQLAVRSYRMALVTSGRPERQRQKVHLLGLETRFSEASGNLLLHDDRVEPDKDRLLLDAAAVLGSPPFRTAAIGDKLDAEIAAARRVGMVTIRMRHGRQKDRRPARPAERPDHTIDCVSDLLRLLP